MPLPSEAALESMLVGKLCPLPRQGVGTVRVFLPDSSRIVKMSSPNLNIVTLLGSCLTYSSAYLFGIQDRDASVGGSMETLIQVGEVLHFCFECNANV